jgi:hypothetical protein
MLDLPKLIVDRDRICTRAWKPLSIYTLWRKHRGAMEMMRKVAVPEYFDCVFEFCLLLYAHRNRSMITLYGG